LSGSTARGLAGAALAALLSLGAVPPPEAESFSPSRALEALLEARRDDGEPIVAQPQRAYFEALPDREKRLFNRAVEKELLTVPEQLQEILSLGLEPTQVKLLMRDNCVLCHTNPDEQSDETLFSTHPPPSGPGSHLNLSEVVWDVHFRAALSCSGCHGGARTDEDMADEIYERWPEAEERSKDRTWIPEFCARCHADPDFMRRFDPGLPTDQYVKYKDSRHGQLLLVDGDSKAAQCVSCHGVHGIRGPKNPVSKVNAQRVPFTCGACHADAEYMKGYTTESGEPLPTDQLEQYKGSVHGKALLERGDLGAPACNDCHGSHAALPPEVASIAQVCRACHAINGELFDGGDHKEAFQRNGWPECEQCHGNHAIETPTDSMMDEASSPLCYDCHREHAKDSEDCIATSKYFYRSISELASDKASLDAIVPELTEKGLDVDPLESAVEDLRESLRQARTRIHAFEISEFEPVVEKGREQVEKAWRLVDEARAEYRFRFNGLLTSVGLTAFLALMLYLKIRSIESGE
jgi:predicted CXXCH cytochrome family protein